MIQAQPGPAGPPGPARPRSRASLGSHFTGTALPRRRAAAEPDRGTGIHWHCQADTKIGRRFAAALLPRLFGTNPWSHHKGATGRVQTGDRRLPVLCHCQLGQDIPTKYYYKAVKH